MFKLTLVDGWFCFLGRLPTCKDGAWWSEIIYSIGTFTAGCCAVILLKQKSAALQWAANILAVPISICVFAIPHLPGHATQNFNVLIIVGVLIVVLGMIIYELGETKLQKIKHTQVKDGYNEESNLLYKNNINV